MAKGKKTDDKPKEGATLSIDVDSFVRTRDSVRLPLSPSFLLIPKTRRIRYLQPSRFVRWTSATTAVTHHPPHINNYCSDDLGRLESHVPVSARPYPDRIYRLDLIVDLAARNAPSLFTFRTTRVRKDNGNPAHAP